MNVKVTKEEGLQRELTIKVPASEMASKEEAKLHEIAKTIKVAGFRPGKVPVQVVKQRHGDAVMNEVLQEAVNDSTTKALADHKLKPAMQPNIDIKKFEPGKDLEYTVSFEMIPAIELKPVDKIKLEKLVTKVDDKAIDEAIERIAGSNKATKTVTSKRALKKGDIALIDFDGSVDGEKKPGMKAEGHELELGSGQFIPGFEDQLIGKKAGDEVSVTVTFPDPYTSEELAGKEAVFEVTIHEIKEYEDAKIDDAFAKQLGLKDLAELKERVEEQIQSEYDTYSRSRLKRELLDTLAESYSFDIPESLAKAELESILQQVEQEKQTHGDTTELDAAAKKEYEQIAERRVRLGLVLSEIGASENITVSREDLNQALIAEARKYQGYERQVFEYYQNNQQAMESLKAPIFEEKVVDFIFEKADVKEKEVSLEELTQDPDEGKDPSNPAGKKKAEKKKTTTAKKKTTKK